MANDTLGFGHGSAGSGAAPRLSWGDMSQTQKIAHSLKHGTNYATKITDEALLAQARRYLEKDARPATNNGTQDNLAQLYAEQNTRAQQEEQAATNQYGMSNAQLGILQSYYDRGILDPLTNQFTAEYLGNADNNDNLYEMYIGGFGLGDNDLHRLLKSQAGAGWEALNQSDEPYDSGGLTFGGSSGYQPPPPPTETPQEGLFNPTQEAGPVRNRNFQTVDYATQGAATPLVNTGIGTASQSQATPWADAYIRAQQASAKQGPISGLFSKEMENS